MKRLCTICVRGGSKGVRGKNTMIISGKPLLAYSIEQARTSGLFDTIAVSSDADYILDTARAWGADLVIARPAELATDYAAKNPVIRHAVRSAEEETETRYDVLVDLDATSPLRLPEDIIGAVGLLEEKGVSQVITGAKARRSPYFNLVERDAEGRIGLSKPANPPIVRRQDAPDCFDMNASVYVWSRSGLFDGTLPFNPDTLLYEMPEERSVDIDSGLDAKIVELIMGDRHLTSE